MGRQVDGLLTMQPRNCQSCNQLFTATATEIRRGNGKYCSRQCFSQRRGQLNQRRCERCGKDYTISPYRAARGGSRFCSATCRGFGSYKRATSAELLNDIKRLARELGHYPSSLEYQRLGEYAYGTFFQRFGSWRAVIEAAGLRYERRHTIEKIPDRVLESDIKRVAQECGHPPTTIDYKAHGKFDILTYYRRVSGAGRSWRKVLEFYFGDDAPQSTKAYTPKQWPTKDEMLADVVKVSRLLGYKPTGAAYEKRGRFSVHQVICKFRDENSTKRTAKWRDVLTMIEDPQSVKQEVKELGVVADPVRDQLKSQSVEAIMEFFGKRQSEGRLRKIILPAGENNSSRGSRRGD